jgi:hypothetical protein
LNILYQLIDNEADNELEAIHHEADDDDEADFVDEIYDVDDDPVL